MMKPKTTFETLTFHLIFSDNQKERNYLGELGLMKEIMKMDNN
jgi:hypothetical protein